MSYSTGPYSEFTSLPAPTTTTLSPSREIDFTTKRYVVDENGNFPAMKNVAQRVVLTVSYAVPEQQFITERDNAQTEVNIRAALEDMTRGPEPEIDLISVSVTGTTPGSLKRLVEYRDLTNGAKETVEV